MKTQNLIILGLIVLVVIAVVFFILSRNQTDQEDIMGKESGILKNITVNKTQSTEESTEENTTNQTTNQENCTEKGSYGNQTPTCSDETPYGQSSENKPKYSSSGNLIDSCSKCGYQSGYTWNTAPKSRRPLPQLQTCSDETPYGQCSENKPKYCLNGNLVDDCVSCGCSNGYVCNTTTKSCYQLPTTQTCSDGTPYGQCSPSKPKQCVNGVLKDNCSVCGCAAGELCNTTTNSCYNPAGGRVVVTVNAPSNVSFGDTFTAEISLTHVSDLAGAQFSLTFNQSVVQVTGHSTGNLAGPGTTIINNTNNAGGFDNLLINNFANPSTGSGSIVLITFKVVGLGGTSTDLNLQNVQLSNSVPEQITVSSVNNAKVMVVCTDDRECVPENNPLE